MPILRSEPYLEEIAFILPQHIVFSIHMKYVTQSLNSILRGFIVHIYVFDRMEIRQTTDELRIADEMMPLIT